MIVVSVGTFAFGFDALVAAADEAARELGQDGFAQIGHSQVVPRHLAWERFVSAGMLQARLRTASVVICHGGAGILGEAMRAARPIIAVPRRGPTSAHHPANDQTGFLDRLAADFPIRVCQDPDDLLPLLAEVLETMTATVTYQLGSNVPQIIARFLAEPYAGVA